MPLRKKGGNGGGHVGFLSPAVRRLLREYELEPATVEGSGARGRITRADVVAAAAARWAAPNQSASTMPRPWPTGPYEPAPPTAAPEPPAAPPAPAPPDVHWPPESEPAAPAPQPEPPAPEPEPPPAALPPPDVPPVAFDPPPVAVSQGGPPVVSEEVAPDWQTDVDDLPSLLRERAPQTDETVHFSAPRRATAERLVRSLHTAAHAFCAVETDFQRLERVRQMHRDRWIREEGFGLTYLPFVARAVIDALGDFPRLNASVGTAELVLRHKVHLGVAIELEQDGLLVPVLRDAETKRLRGLAREATELTRRVREGTLTPEDVSEGTFTITDPGPFGTLVSIPIINHPEVAVLATDGVRRRPVIVRTPDGSDGFTVHPVGLVGLSFDHRAVETDYAAAFLDRVRVLLETRDWEQEL